MATKKLLSKALSWFKKSEESAAVAEIHETEAIEAPVKAANPITMSAPTPTPTPTSMPAPTPTPPPKVAPAPAPIKAEPIFHPTPSAPKVKAPQPAPAVVPTPPIQTIIEEGPEIKITTKGSKVYAICPHCEATWNLKERLLVYSTKRIAAALTCPSCDKAISLPVSLNLKKLSSM